MFIILYTYIYVITPGQWESCHLLGNWSWSCGKEKSCRKACKLPFQVKPIKMTVSVSCVLENSAQTQRTVGIFPMSTATKWFRVLDINGMNAKVATSLRPQTWRPQTWKWYEDFVESFSWFMTLSHMDYPGLSQLNRKTTQWICRPLTV